MPCTVMVPGTIWIGTIAAMLTAVTIAVMLMALTIGTRIVTLMLGTMLVRPMIVTRIRRVMVTSRISGITMRLTMTVHSISDMTSRLMASIGVRRVSLLVIACSDTIAVRISRVSIVGRIMCW
jgi:hypothetical protein